MEERIPSYEELLAKARLALRDKKLRAIVEETRSPNAANDIAESRRFKREKVLSCHTLARIKKYYPEKYEELKNKKVKPVQAKAEAPVSVSKPPKPNWRKWLYVGVAIVVCLSLVLVGVLVRNNNQSPSDASTKYWLELNRIPVAEKANMPSPDVIIDPALGSPCLLTPADMAKGQPVRYLELSWSVIKEAEGYELVLSSAPGFKEEDIVLRDIVPFYCNEYFIYFITNKGSIRLEADAMYFWRVRALKGDWRKMVAKDMMEAYRAGAWSETWTFWTETPPLMPIDAQNYSLK